MPEDAEFYAPDGVRERFRQGIGTRGQAARRAWEAQFEQYRAAYLGLAGELERIQRRELPDGWEAALPAFPPDEKGIASRDSSGQVLNQLAQAIPWLLGCSADLSPSTKTSLVFDGAGDFQVGNRSGRNMHLGIREHASAAIADAWR